MYTMSGGRLRPTTAAAASSHTNARSQSATLYRSGNNSRVMSASPGGRGGAMTPLPNHQRGAEGGASVSPTRAKADDDVTGPNPSAFHSIYEVSYSPPRERPEIQPNNRRGFGAEPTPLPPHVNPASLREKKEYFYLKSRDAPPATEPSKYIVAFQHHLRNESKAEVSRHVRKTEPPTLDAIFGHTVRKDVSADEIILARNERLRAEAAERDRQRSLLYDRHDYYTRHPEVAAVIEGAGTDVVGSRIIHKSPPKPRCISDLLQQHHERSEQRERMGRSMSATRDERYGDTYNHHQRREISTAANNNNNTATAKTSSNTNSPTRYPKLYFNMKQFERYARPGWDAVANAKKAKRSLEQQQGWQADWTSGTSTDTEHASAVRTANRLAMEFNRSQASGRPADYVSVMRGQRPTSAMMTATTEEDGGRSDLTSDRQQQQYHGGDGYQSSGRPPMTAAAGGSLRKRAASSGAAHSSVNNTTTHLATSTSPYTLLSPQKRTLPTAMRDRIRKERSNTDAIMQCVEDPTLRQDLEDKQRHWLAEYESLRGQIAAESERKAAALKQIRSMQKQSVGRCHSSCGDSTFALV